MTGITKGVIRFEGRPPTGPSASPGRILSTVDLDRTLSRERYNRRLSQLRKSLRSLQIAYRFQDRWAVVVLEGWDTAGKGGAIRRMATALDPRGVHVWPIGPPEPADQRHHYLRRFWQRLPARGELAIFDRSWYGRVLVERVERLVGEAEWGRAYDEIRAFEKTLLDEDIRVVKLFLHISVEEQSRRLEDRAADPLKRWKLSPADFRNLSARDAYLEAAGAMFERTATADAPWFIIPAEDKRFGRVAVMDTIVRCLSHDVDLAPPPLTDDVSTLLRRSAVEDGDCQH